MDDRETLMEVIRMRNLTTLSLLILAFLIGLMLPAPVSAQTRIGGGIHYLRTLGDIKNSDQFDENALGFMASIVTGSALRLEGDLEIIPDFGGTGKVMLQPQAYAMLGQLIYGGVGIGIGHFNGDWQSNPFYALRAGVNLPLGGMAIDLFASYRFQKDKNLSEFGDDDLNSITFGALLRFGS